jgi:predicted RNA-binding Zn-ribbon protein involved in translation (DUF1610 family)
VRSEDNCPGCGVDLTGPEIDPVNRKYYAPGTTHYQQTISVVVGDHHDHWQCPECGHTWGHHSPLKESTDR